MYTVIFHIASRAFFIIAFYKWDKCWVKYGINDWMHPATANGNGNESTLHVLALNDGK